MTLKCNDKTCIKKSQSTDKILKFIRDGVCEHKSVCRDLHLRIIASEYKQSYSKDDYYLLCGLVRQHFEEHDFSLDAVLMYELTTVARTPSGDVYRGIP